MEFFNDKEKMIFYAEKLKKHGDFIRQRKEVSPDTYNTVKAVIEGKAAESGKSIIEAMVVLCHEQREDEYAVIWLIGVACILIEESDC